jgi:hypothetical protein
MNNNDEVKKIEKNYELIKFEDGDFSLDVNVSPKEETVWLNRTEISLLFERDIKTISKHINNALQEECKNSKVAKIATVQLEGNRYVEREISYYSLEVIISVGYRVKSNRGILFRRWANSVLKQYLVNGYIINENRCLAYGDNIIHINNTINHMNSTMNVFNDRLTNVELRLDTINSIDIFKDKIFYNNELFEGYSFIKNLFSKAKNRIIIIDGYLDYSVLEMMNDINIDITIYIASHTPITNREIALFQTNHSLNIIRTNIYHDRFIIIDNELYNVGSSIKDIGKKISHISKLESINIEELLNKY